MRYPHIEDALPQRKHLYVGRGEDTVRMEPRIPVFGRPKSAGGESWVESHNRPYADRIKKTRESLQSGDFYSDYEQQLEHVPFRKPFSKKTVNVSSVQKEDVAFDPSIKSISANVEGLPPSSLYGYQAGSTGHKANMFNSRLPNRHGSKGYKEIRMSVPEKEVIYRTNNTANSDIRKNLGNPPMSPEMVVPARYLNKENTK
jgi:hypothetical protein